MDVKTLIKNCESATLECKKSSGGLPNSIWETYSAFANTNGGTILLGIEEISKELFIRGVQSPQDLIKMIWDNLNNAQKVSVNILSDRHIYVENIDGMDVVVIEVPRADRHDKPVYIGNDCFSGSFRRNFEGGISDPRNPVIFKMFSLINVGERAGSGLSNIRRAWEEQHWEKPALIETFEPERTTLKLKIETLTNKTDGNSDESVVKEIDGKSTDNDGKTTVKRHFNQTQEKIIALTKQNSRITIDDMADIIGITKRNVEKNIKILKDEGILKRVGGKKDGHWETVPLCRL